MVYVVECSLRDFPAYGQAKENLDKIKSYDDENGTNIFEALAAFCDDAFENNGATATEINNFLIYDVPDMEDESWSEVFED